MPRPRKRRRISFSPLFSEFSPDNCFEKIVYLTLDEFEAIRLKDYMGLNQQDCAQKMAISQPTFHRIILSARKKIANALITGSCIKIRKV